MSTNNQNALLTSNEALEVSIRVASEDAYRALSYKVYTPDEVHRLGVCYQVTSLIVERLLGDGYLAEHEIRSGLDVPEHSYVTLNTDQGDEIIIDPTWQQFLPKSKVTVEMPKVLMGTRASVIEQASHFGVDEQSTKLWQKQGVKMMVKQQKRADLDARKKADQAERNGGWEKFIAQSH